MYAKLVWRNIRRSIGDYAVYFLTLTFAVALFYVFNSLPDSSGLSSSSAVLRDNLRLVMTNLSLIVAIVTAFLILYANNFLIKKRNREIGAYLVMGMEQRRLSLLLLAETLLLGLLALIAGLLAGVGLAQIFAFVVAGLFDSSFDLVQFSFSPDAMRKTILCFAVIFAVVALLTCFRLARIRVIDLLNGARRQEKLPSDRPVLGTVLFCAALACLGTAYYLGFSEVMVFNNGARFTVLFVLGIAGTYLFYFAVSNFLYLIISKNQNRYYRGLNVFTFRQVASKLRMSAAMMGTVSLMLFVTVCTFAGGFGINAFCREQVATVSPHDAEYALAAPVEDAELEEWLAANGHPLRALSSATVRTDEAVTLGEALLPADREALIAQYDYPEMFDGELSLLSLSDYNALRQGSGLPPVTLNDDEFGFHASAYNNNTSPYLIKRFEQGGPLTVGGADLRPAADGYRNDVMISVEFCGAVGFYILPDAVADTLPVGYTLRLLDLETAPTTAEQDGEVLDLLREFTAAHGDGFYSVNSRLAELETIYGSKALAVFAGLYLGLMFLLISMTLLALKQLTDAAEHKGRYDILMKLGADERRIRGSVFKQVLLYFMAPLLLAVVNGAIGVAIIVRYFLSAGGYNVAAVVAVTAAILIVFYVLYFIASYRGYRRILRQTNRDHA